MLAGAQVLVLEIMIDFLLAVAQLLSYLIMNEQIGFGLVIIVQIHPSKKSLVVPYLLHCYLNFKILATPSILGSRSS
jgi:hypothetical protein